MREDEKLEPIAVIGMAVKFPQDASSQESFWQMLLCGKSAMTEVVAKNRVNIDAYYHPDKDHIGTMNARGGHFIQEDLEGFDAPFFSMTGISLHDAMGSKTSVHVGSFLHEHELLIAREPEAAEPHKSTGASQALLANRLSWFYNFSGPSITVDTACSSTLHALHLSCQSLRSRESTMGVVAGSNIIYNPQSMISMAESGLLSPDSLCHTFDHRANGYSRGEGVAAIILKPLDLAIQDGDTVRAVIRSTSLNQDGRTSGGITQPSSAAQVEVIRQTYEKAGLSMAQTQYFEAHGTGTTLGDLAETSAIGSALQHTKRDAPLLVRALKTNIGHLEANSALAALVKVILILERGSIPPNINFKKLNPEIKAKEWNIQFPHTAMPWPGSGVRRASINSFGLGGANGHAVIDDAYSYLRGLNLSRQHTGHIYDGICKPAPEYKGSTDPHPNGYTQQIYRDGPQLFVWSTVDRDGIGRVRDLYKGHLERVKENHSDNAYIESLSYTLSERRSHFKWRSFAIANTLAELSSTIQHLTENKMDSKSRKLGFVFTGQGVQWYAMGRELFAYAVGWSTEVELHRDKYLSRVAESSLSQPLCVALQVALVDLLRSWNATPSVVIGHSSREIAAAYCAGFFCHGPAIKIAFYRGVVMSNLRKAQKEPCGMLAVGLSTELAQEYIDKLHDFTSFRGITIACINSPHNVTVAGPLELLDTLKRLLDGRNIFARKLNVDMAYHSSHMLPGEAMYIELLQGLDRVSETRVIAPMISSVTARVVSKTEIRTPEYWSRNLVAQVNFAGALSYMYSPEFASTQRYVCDNISESSSSPQLHYHALIRHDKFASRTALEAAGKLHCLGFPVDIANVNKRNIKTQMQQLVDLPPYPFNHSNRYWVESRVSKNSRFRKFPRHDLFGSQVPDWNPFEAKWRNYLRLGENPWLTGHMVNGTDVSLNQVLEPHFEPREYRFRDVLFIKALSSSREGPNKDIETEFYLQSSQDTTGKPSVWWTFSLYMLDNEEWTQCCKGFITVQSSDSNCALSIYGSDSCGKTLGSHLSTFDRTLDSQQLYQHLEAMGLTFTLKFQALRDIRYEGSGRVTAVSDMHHWQKHIPGKPLAPHVIHPAALDSLFQLTAPALTRGTQDIMPTFVPTRLDYLYLYSNINSSQDSCACMTVKAEPEGFTRAKASGHAVHAASGTPWMSAAWQIAAVTSITDNLTDESTNIPVCYSLHTKPDVDFVDGKQTEAWCTLDTDPYIANPEMTQTNDALCFLVMAKVIQRFPNARDIVKRVELQKYLEWTQGRLDETKSFTQEWMAHINDNGYFETLVKQVQGSGTEERLHARVAENLERFFSGELNAVEFLYSDSSLNDMYDYGIGIPCVFQQVARYIDALAFKNSALRILEVGAGTGSATKHVIRALENHTAQKAGVSRFSEYRFSDLSTAFLERGREMFPDHAESGNMKFSIFDVEKTPEQQNLEQETYDLVIAFNAIHATSSIRVSLKNCRKLLKPGGRIILIELTGSHMMQLDFIFGLLPGWWLGVEDHRKNGPLMSEQSWHTCLQESGFSGLDIALRNHQDENYHTYTAMVSTAIGVASGSQVSRNMIIVVSHNLQKHYCAIGNCQVVTLSDLKLIIMDSAHYIFLLEIEDHFLHGISSDEFLLLQKALSSASIGLMGCQTYQAEHEGLHFATFFLEGNSIGDFTAVNIAKPEEDSEFVEQDGLIFINRVQEASRTDGRCPQPRDRAEPQMRKLGFESPGLLNTLNFFDDPEPATPLQEDEIEIRIQYSGINFRDLLTGLGQLNDIVLGLEGSGMVTKAGLKSGFTVGDKVCALFLGSFQTYGRCKAKLARHIPENLDLSCAAAMPIIFCTAYHALVNLAQLKPGESVLIHSAAGGLGQAAVQIAKLFDVEIFATVGSEEKRQLLIDLRSLAFADAIKKSTHGHGVDVVLNSLAGDGLRTSWECIAPFGRFIETGRKDIGILGNLPMASFADDTSFSSVNLVNIIRRKPDLAGQLLESVLELAGSSKIFVPKPLQIYGVGQLEDAFRLMQSGKNSGKLVVELRETDFVRTTPSSSAEYQLKPDVSYLIAGGLGGIRRSVSRWMVSRGARYLILLSRSRKSDPDTFSFLDELRSTGAKVEASVCDISDRSSLVHALEAAQSTMPPVKGCIQATMLQRNGQFDTLSKPDFDAALKPKVDGSWNLHSFLSQQLDFFILFSSVSGIAPSFGQTSYAAGNTFQDSLARYRVSHGKNAVSIDIGLVEDAGFATRQAGMTEQLLARAVTPIHLDDILEVLDFYCNESLPILSQEECQVILGLYVPGALRAIGAEEPYWIRRPQFRYLSRATDCLATKNTTGSQSHVKRPHIPSLETLLPLTQSIETATALVSDAFVTKLTKILVMDRKDVQMNNPIHAHGVDSLVAMELRE
ncbi:hypothetical protein BO71DRAFT_455222 [Aspergillus ellipticus CBS 707.79]|uniref:Carrier domain-containing protein n=1 Tax=Aspergillus ellipticus CBS 707.79 TaxID=1448320 RepID=A0A319F2J4_9EURO|nr:hypothetical protein BO71DRAFT_455222 [Aspergillus ellipticus CBS 707.79]